MTLKHRDFSLVIEVINNARAKRQASALGSRDVAEMMSALNTCGWIVIRRGELDTLRRIVRGLEGKE